MTYLSGELAKQASEGRKYVEYYDSEDNTLAYAQKKFAEVFGKMFHGWRDNFAPLIVDSISERLTIKGFRMEANGEADKEANEIWQRSFLDADSNSGHVDALVQGLAHLIVWPETKDGKDPLITPEPADQVYAQLQPGSRRKVMAAIKQYTDDWGTTHATMFLPKAVYTARREDSTIEWKNLKRINNPLGLVPVVPLTNRKRLRADPYSELAAILPIQNAINKVAADAIVASEFAAFPQRVLSNLEPFDDENEEADRQKMLKAYIDRILTFDGDVNVDQFDAADLGNYVKLIDMLVQHMASQSRVPFHYFLLNGGQAPSGESITAAEAGLVAKARERMLHFGESWETAMRIAFQIKGDEKKARAWGAETIWGDPEHRSKATLVDSLIKLKELDVPVKQLQEDYGYSPQQILRFIEMKEEELKRQKEWRDKYEPQPVEPGTPGRPGTPGSGQANRQAGAKSAEVERRKEKEIRKAA